MGRPRAFDEPSLLAAAEDLFWSNGYDNTSIQEIATASGVGNGSLYSAYGNKRGLFLKVFQRYCRAKALFVEEALTKNATYGIDAVRFYFGVIIADCASQPQRRGCLMLNSIAELSSRIPEVVTISAESTRSMERSVASRLRVPIAGPSDDLDDAQAAKLGAFVVLVSQSLIQLSRIGATVAQLNDFSVRSSWALHSPALSLAH